MRLLGAAPLRLVLLALVPAVWAVVLYALKLSNQRESVAYLPLWRKVAARMGRRRGLGRLETSVSLLLQLAFVALVALAIGRPRLNAQVESGRALVFVLDNSASMRALEGRSERFELARARLRSLVADLADLDQAALVTTCPPEVVVALGPRGAALTSAVGRVRAVEGSGQLGQAVDTARALLLARAAAQPGSKSGIHVITDGSEPLAEARDDLPVAVDTVGRARDNLGIVALAARADPGLADAVRVFVEVRNFAGRGARADLRLSVDDRLIAVIPLELAAGARLWRSVTTPSSERGELTARLDQISIPGSTDALAADDVAYAIMPKRGDLRIGFSGRNPFLAAALRAHPRYRVEPVGAAGLAAGGAGRVALVTDGPLPERLGPGGYVVFAPVGGDLPMRVVGTVAQPTFTDWRDDHPVLRSVALADVTVARSSKVLLGSGATPIATFFDEPLLWTVDDGARRAVVIGFDPSDSNLPLRASFTILLYNAISWVSAERPTAERVQVGATLHAASGDTVVDRLGFVRLHDGATYAASLVDAAESAVAPTRLAATRGGRFTTPRFFDRELWPALLWLALLLMLVEWWTYHARVTS